MGGVDPEVGSTLGADHALSGGRVGVVYQSAGSHTHSALQVVAQYTPEAVTGAVASGAAQRTSLAGVGVYLVVVGVRTLRDAPEGGVVRKVRKGALLSASVVVVSSVGLHVRSHSCGAGRQTSNRPLIGITARWAYSNTGASGVVGV